MHIPARRVQRYQDDEDVMSEEHAEKKEEEEQAETLRPALTEMEQNHIQDKGAGASQPAPVPAAPDPPLSAPLPAPDSDERACDYLQLMLDEAERQHLAGYTPANPHNQKSMAKETTFRGIRFIKVRRAGEGGFSTVWQVRGPTAIPAAVPGAVADEVRMEPVDERRQGYFAMKQVSLRRLEPESRDELVQEAQLLEHLAQQPGHEHYVLRYFSHRVNRDTLKILLELGDMDFSHMLKVYAPLSRAQICEYWRQMLEAVHFVHEKGNLVHTDLKPANFLMAKGRLKLIDFGIAQKIPLGTIHISREAIVGTPNYMAPEAIQIAKKQGRRVYKAGKASDVWSLGCILYQMVYGRPPFDRLSGEKKLEVIMDPNHHIPFPPHRVLDDPASEAVDPALLNALTSTLRYDAQQRDRIPALLNSDLFRDDALLDERVTITRRTLHTLVKRLQQHAVQGELTEDNAIERADVLFDNLRATSCRNNNNNNNNIA